MAFSFGGQSATTRPSLFGGTPSGGIFGQTASSASTGFSFGQPAQSVTSTGFGGFAAPAATTAAPTGFGGFGAATSSSAPTFGFGASSTATQSFGFGGFGTTTTAAAGAGFGVTTTTVGGFGTSKFGTGGFGLATTSAASSGFGAGLGLSTGGFGTAGSLFGAKPLTTTTIGQQPAAAAAAAGGQQSPAQLVAAVTAPVLFGDERDGVLTKWNQLQAFWGAGRAYVNQQGQAVELNNTNPYALFKAVGYACIPTARNEDGLMSLVINKKIEEVRGGQQQVVDTLHRILGSKPNLTVCVESLRTLLDDNKTELTLYVQDRNSVGCSVRVMASDVESYLTQPACQQQLINSLHVTNIYTKAALTPHQLKLYLDIPPSGIDGRIWEQAKQDNPDPSRFIPVPIVGFEELRNRLKHQCQQTDLHLSRLDMLASDILTLQHRLSDMIAKLDEYKRLQLVLSHRVLKVLVGQEIDRKCGYAVQAYEEQLRAHVESINAQLSAPAQFKGRLNELMSQLRLQENHMHGGGGGLLKLDSQQQIDKSTQADLRQHLKQQQEGLRCLIDIINKDLEHLRIIELGMTRK